MREEKSIASRRRKRGGEVIKLPRVFYGEPPPPDPSVLLSPEALKLPEAWAPHLKAAHHHLRLAAEALAAIPADEMSDEAEVRFRRAGRTGALGLLRVVWDWRFELQHVLFLADNRERLAHCHAEDEASTYDRHPEMLRAAVEALRPPEHVACRRYGSVKSMRRLAGEPDPDFEALMARLKAEVAEAEAKATKAEAETRGDDHRHKRR